MIREVQKGDSRRLRISLPMYRRTAGTTCRRFKEARLCSLQHYVKPGPDSTFGLMHVTGATSNSRPQRPSERRRKKVVNEFTGECY